MKYIFFFLILSSVCFGQTVIIDGQEYLPDTIVNNGNQLLIRFQAVQDTAKINQDIEFIDQDIERLEEDIKRAQNEIKEARKKRAKLNAVLNRNNQGITMRNNSPKDSPW